MGGTEINYGDSFHVKTAQDQAAVLQGHNDMTKAKSKSKRTKSSSRRTRPRSSDSEVYTPVDEDATTTTTEASRGQSRSRSESFKEAVGTGPEATYPVSPSNQPRYYRLEHGKAEEGDIFRISKPNNDVMHRQTVVIIRARGTILAVCRIQHCIPVDSEPHFRHYNAEVKIKRDHESSKPNDKDDRGPQAPKTGKASANLDPVTVVMDENQEIHEDCWLNLSRSFDMNVEDNYEVVYCGKLTSESRRFAKENFKRIILDED